MLFGTLAAYQALLGTHTGQCAATFTTAPARAAFERLWRDRCYTPAASAESLQVTRRARAAFLHRHAFHDQLTEARRLLPSGVSAVARMLGAVAAVVVAAPSASTRYSVLQSLPSHAASFRHLKMIPRIVRLYDWLYHRLGHVLSTEQVGAGVGRGRMCR